MTSTMQCTLLSAAAASIACNFGEQETSLPLEVNNNTSMDVPQKLTVVPAVACKTHRRIAELSEDEEASADTKADNSGVHSDADDACSTASHGRSSTSDGPSSVSDGPLTRMRWSDMEPDSDDDWTPVSPRTETATSPSCTPPSKALLDPCASCWTPSWDSSWDSSSLECSVAYQPALIPYNMPLSSTSFVPPIMQPTEKRLFAEIVAAGLGALRGASSVNSVSVVENSYGWTLACSANTSLLTFYEDFQSASILAQQAMLEAAEYSDSVYIVGYEVQPFTVSGDGCGFMATLAIVKDEATACHDLLARGVCHRGCTCRWQHPVLQVSMSVILEWEQQQ